MKWHPRRCARRIPRKPWPKATHHRRQSTMIRALHTKFHHKAGKKSTLPGIPNQAEEGLCINIRVKRRTSQMTLQIRPSSMQIRLPTCRLQI
nr:MAG TPA: hypothetical protein [Caudoviricetes sp.]